MENQMQDALRKRLSPEGRAAVEEMDQVSGLGLPPSEGLLGRIDALPEEDRAILARLLEHRGHGHQAAAQDARSATETTERLLAAINRAAKLEGVDSSTLTVRDAQAILARHGESL